MNKKEQSSTSNTQVMVAEYIRMSTEHQQYSTDNQAELIREYAAKRSMKIVRTYSDAGKSGLSLNGRDALKQLIDDVKEGKAEFQAILVYDVSRWGRFQDVDQAAYYEYICKRQGISVHYCAEMFENDDSLVSVVFKNVKRAMAGEYSRELSAKVFKGQCHLIELGYRQGGVAGYGLRRMRVDQTGNHLGILRKGEYKNLQTDRVILVPGPIEEVAVVREIFDLFVQKKRSEKEISYELTLRGVKNEDDHPWSRGGIHQILINEKYIGNNVFNKTSYKLKKKRVKNSPDLWVRGNGVFVPLVDPEVFWEAQRIIHERSIKLSDEEMLEHLRGLLNGHGRISGILIDESEGLPSSSAYKTRFGSLIRAYRLIGYTPERDFQYLEENKRIRDLYPEVVKNIIFEIKEHGGQVFEVNKGGALLVNHELTICVTISRCRQTPSGIYRWHLRLEHLADPDITIAIRMNHQNESVLDYYILPKMDIAGDRLRLSAHNGLKIDAYRHNNLSFFYSLVKRVNIRGAA